MIKLSLGTWPFVVGESAQRPLPFEACLSRAKELGYAGVELSAQPPHPTPETHPTKESRAALRQQIDALGLGISGLGIGVGEHSPFQDDQDAYVAAFERNLDFCADLGIRSIRVDTCLEPDRVPAAEEQRVLERTCASWKRCARAASARGIRVVWEFEPGFVLNKPSQIMAVVQGVDEPNFGVLYDTCHAHMVAALGARQNGPRETLAGGALELLEMLRGYVGGIHVIDSDGTLHEGITSTHAPVGEGELDFDALVPALIKCGAPVDWWCVDLCFWPQPWEAAETCKRALDEYLQKYDR